ncbi:MAG: CDGSH iron-sulfur domain-containing protein [Gaiellales bacterium]
MGEKIKVNENGPYVIVTGGTYCLDGGEVHEQPAIALCRCGQSGTKPFCDGTHKRVGFEAPAGEIALDS